MSQTSSFNDPRSISEVWSDAISSPLRPFPTSSACTKKTALGSRKVCCKNYNGTKDGNVEIVDGDVSSGQLRHRRSVILWCINSGAVHSRLWLYLEWDRIRNWLTSDMMAAMRWHHNWNRPGIHWLLIVPSTLVIEPINSAYSILDKGYRIYFDDLSNCCRHRTVAVCALNFKAMLLDRTENRIRIIRKHLVLTNLKVSDVRPRLESSQDSFAQCLGREYHMISSFEKRKEESYTTVCLSV